MHGIAILLVSLVKIVVLMFVLMTSLAYLVWLERKVAAHIQGRWGPYRVGPHGLMQPLADALKFLFKEDTTPAGADRFVYFLAPFVTLSLAISTIALIPFGPGAVQIFGQRTPLVIANVNIGLLAVFAITSIGVYGVALAGWSSNNKYSLLGGLRSAAQMISYELSLTMSVAGVLLLAGTFNMSEIITAQSGYTWGFLPRWNLLSPTAPQFLGFFCYFVAAVAETNRLPFDLAEAESELVAGFHTEYSSFKFAMFFMGEYASMITVSCLATILFFGGWLSPFPQTAAFAWARYLPAAAIWRRGHCSGVEWLTVQHGVGTSDAAGNGNLTVRARGIIGPARFGGFLAGALVVRSQGAGDPIRLYLGALDAAAIPLRPTHGHRLEIPAAGGAG